MDAGPIYGESTSDTTNLTAEMSETSRDDLGDTSNNSTSACKWSKLRPLNLRLLQGSKHLGGLPDVILATDDDVALRVLSVGLQL